MGKLAFWLVAFGLGAVVVFHLYWAGGGRKGADAVIPRRPLEQGGAPLFSPSPLGTFSVAMFLAGVLGLAAAVQQGADLVVPWAWTRVLLAACGLVFIVRAIGEFRYVGFFKRVKDSPFAYWDTRLFSPFILLIGIACLVIAGAAPKQPFLT
jgi:hypothetical protein